MGVRINSSKTFKTPINFVVLTADGKPENWSFIAEFKRLTTDEVAEILDEDTKDKEKLRKVLVGWKMEDLETKEDTPFTPDNFDFFCSVPKAAGNTMLRFLEMVGANREKNSVR